MVELPLGRYRFAFEAVEPGCVGAFAGSAWRGAFGAALKRTVCVTRLPACDACPLVGTCVFPSLFEGRQRSDAARLSSLSRVPVPFVFDPPTTSFVRFAPGEPVAVDLTLVGDANRRLPYIVHAMAEAGARGLGPARARLTLAAVDRLAGLDGTPFERLYDGAERCRAVTPVSPAPAPYDAPELTVELRTPLRLRLDGDLVTPERFVPAHLIHAVVRRVSALAAFHAGAPIEADYRSIRDLALRVGIAGRDLRWADRRRYSSRQGQLMAMGGLVGRCAFTIPPEARSLIPWLQLGQWVGAGKGASMGLGQYRLHPADGADA
ncbi:MAG: CRISPR system precrRNA processing endoribonuclease RAMP protein Cas6 [Rhodospirillaceae bacterium]|nr:CRISPR system precrRNA processing endoribonuclease RAMP protein Cas6 [Rhodospirillaceae bacterium]